MRKVFTAQQKAVVALEAIKEEKSVAQLSSIYEVHATQIKQWKKIAMVGLSTLFTDKRRVGNDDQQSLINELHRIIGQRETELEWLKKKLQLNSSTEIGFSRTRSSPN